MPSPIKISSPETRGFWEVPVLYEDEWLLALDKPEDLHTVKEPDQPGRPGIMGLLHAAVEAGKPWAKERGLSFLAHTHRVDLSVSGVLLLAKNQEVASAVANVFGSEKPLRRYLALVKGTPRENTFEFDARMGPDPLEPGLMHLDSRGGKKSRTQFEVVERFGRWALLACLPFTDRPHQIRLHLRHVGLPIVGDDLYRGGQLMLSAFKPGFRLKPNKTERPLMTRAALHLETISLPHPVTNQPLVIRAELPKDFAVALKYLRKYSYEL